MKKSKTKDVKLILGVPDFLQLYVNVSVNLFSQIEKQYIKKLIDTSYFLEYALTSHWPETSAW